MCGWPRSSFILHLMVPVLFMGREPMTFIAFMLVLFVLWSDVIHLTLIVMHVYRFLSKRNQYQMRIYHDYSDDSCIHQYSTNLVAVLTCLFIYFLCVPHFCHVFVGPTIRVISPSWCLFLVRWYVFMRIPKHHCHYLPDCLEDHCGYAYQPDRKSVV